MSGGGKGEGCSPHVSMVVYVTDADLANEECKSRLVFVSATSANYVLQMS